MSALQHNTTHMSDNNPSGAPSAAPGAAPSGEVPGFGSFGANRGSGLARGKRPTPAAAPAANAPTGAYKPSSVEVITPKSEYVNPFTGETAVSAPVSQEPAAPVAPAKVDVTEAAPAAATPAPAPAAPTGDLFPLDAPAAPAAKAELNILPPQEVKRPAVSWDSGSTTPAPREERATFRSDRPTEPRESKPFQPREPRRDERKFEPRGQPYHHYDDREETREAAPAAEPAKKSGGFFGWLKRLFGGKSEGPANAGGEQRSHRDGEHGGRRRHRGGRGRNRGGFQGENRGGFQGENRGPREEGGQSHGGGEGFHGGGGRRRRRGGRGRYPGGGDRGPRPEGQQGGGAI